MTTPRRIYEVGLFYFMSKKITTKTQNLLLQRKKLLKSQNEDAEDLEREEKTKSEEETSSY
jgi:hypothetical protein